MADVLPENDRREAYTAADGQDVFEITFPLDDVGDLEVYQDGGFIVGHTVDLDALTVTLDVPAALGDSIVLVGITLVKRERNYPRRGGLDTQQLNGEMTQIIRILQEAKRDTGRTIGLSPAEAS